MFLLDELQRLQKNNTTKMFQSIRKSTFSYSFQTHNLNWHKTESTHHKNTIFCG